MDSRYVQVNRSFLDGFRTTYSVDSLLPFALTPPLMHQGKVLRATTIEEAEEMVRDQHPEGRLPYWRELLVTQDRDPHLTPWEITGTRGYGIRFDDATDSLDLFEGGSQHLVHVPRGGGYVTRFGKLGFAEEVLTELPFNGEMHPLRVYQRDAGREFVAARRVLRGPSGMDVYLDLEHFVLREPAVVRAVVPVLE